ncbi:MAG: O-antigen ligase family protein [Anaerolineaceae bacterium]|nr:O-antigen ligase family protein [Anaerolineaceae bacterium]
MIKRVYQTFMSIIWALLVVSLPITSFPLLANIFGGTSVAPLSVVFLIPLLVIWYLPKLIKEKNIPKHALPLLLFIVFVLISSLAGYYFITPSFRSIPVWRSIFEAIVTLGMGVCFYLVVSKFIDNESKLRTFIKLINYSGLIMVLYALAQAIVFYVLWRYPEFMKTFQKTISSSGILFVRRTTGLAYEPSWYAHLLNMLYLPIWLGMSIKKESVHKFRVLKISLENVLLVLGSISLFLSFSRIGWLGFIAVLGYLIFRLMILLSRILVVKIQKIKGKDLSRQSKIFLQIGFWFVTLISMVSILIVAGIILTKLDPRMEGLFDLALIREKGLLEWAGELIFAERLMYWVAGYRVFLNYPILGIGLGKVGYYFQQTFTSFGYKLPEIISVIIRKGFIPNAKNLWVRILAETGIVGFSIFTAWLYVHWKSARSIEKNENTFLSSFGLVGQIFLIALILEGFSLDSFGLPYYWVSLGVIVAVYRLVVRKGSNSIDNESTSM